MDTLNDIGSMSADGQSGTDTHFPYAPALTLNDEAGQGHSGNPPKGAGLISQIVITNRMRNQLVEANRKLTLQIKAIHRLTNMTNEQSEMLATHVCMPLLAAQEPVLEEKKKLEKTLSKLAKQLHVYPWWKAHKGLGDLGLAQIVGEAEDLSRYRTVSCLWKRFGLHVEGGKAARPKRGECAGYSPRRRSVMHVIGDSFMKSHGHYRQVYLDRKEYETNRGEEMRPIVAHMRALRFAEKRLLRDLYVEWRNGSA